MAGESEMKLSDFLSGASKACFPPSIPVHSWIAIVLGCFQSNQAYCKALKQSWVHFRRGWFVQVKMQHVCKSDENKWTKDLLKRCSQYARTTQFVCVESEILPQSVPTSKALSVTGQTQLLWEAMCIAESGSISLVTTATSGQNK